MGVVRHGLLSVERVLCHRDIRFEWGWGQRGAQWTNHKCGYRGVGQTSRHAAWSHRNSIRCQFRWVVAARSLPLPFCDGSRVVCCCFCDVLLVVEEMRCCVLQCLQLIELSGLPLWRERLERLENYMNIRGFLKCDWNLIYIDLVHWLNFLLP